MSLVHIHVCAQDTIWCIKTVTNLFLQIQSWDTNTRWACSLQVLGQLHLAGSVVPHKYLTSACITCHQSSIK